MANKKSQKIPKKFVCINCDYNTCNSKDYYKHCSTQKHKRLITTNEKSQKSPKNNETLTCSCGKTYKHLSSLYKHKKSCSNENMNEKYQDKIDKLTNIVLDIVNKNTELTQKIVELSSKPIINNIYNDNKTFNLNIFLNEECKHAVNIRDFIESIQLQINDLENIGHVGYVEGISQIFINRLENLRYS